MDEHASAGGFHIASSEAIDETNSSPRLNFPSNHLNFVLNGRNVVVREPDPTTTLADYLRSVEVGLTGTKISCGEGGCGACTVLLSRWSNALGSVVDTTVNACLRPLCSIDGAAITTVEGVGSSRQGLNVIQQRVVEHSASQCGYCTPGFVMQMCGLLLNDSNPSSQDVENGFDGNLCRCTGYRPILDAMQSFVGDPEAARMVVNSIIQRGTLPALRRLHFEGSGYTWLRLLNLDDLLLFLAETPDAQEVKLVDGNTCAGVYKRDIYDPKILIDISEIEELKQCQFSETKGIFLGGGATYTQAMDFLEKAIIGLPPSATAGYVALLDQIQRIGNHQVRNAGTLAGGLMMRAIKPYPSDLATVLLALGASVHARSPLQPDEEIILTIDDVPTYDKYPKGIVVTAIFIPVTTPGSIVQNFKVARRSQNAHAVINAGLMLRQENNVICDASLIIGGLLPGAWRARETEVSLVGQIVSQQTLQQALAILKAEAEQIIVPMPDTGIGIEYRITLTLSLFYKFFLSVAEQLGLQDIPADVASAAVPFIRPVSSGDHGFLDAPYNGEVDGSAPAAVTFEAVTPQTHAFAFTSPQPVAQNETKKAPSPATAPMSVSTNEPVPLKKIGIDIQTTGEAKYTHDLSAMPPACVTRFVLSRHSLAWFEHSVEIDELIDDTKQRFPGVLDYVTARDIIKPRPADTYVVTDPGQYDPIFARDIVTCYGQSIGLVVADNELTATLAAEYIEGQIQYTTSGLSPVIGIEKAVEAGSYLPIGAPKNSHFPAITRLNSDVPWLDKPTKEDNRIFLQGKQVAGSQSHFYMEPQATVAVPGEPGYITLYSSSQHLGTCQEWAADILNIPTSCVDAKAMRLGGGFGGKEVRPSYFAAAAAVAAWKLGRPVRVALDRNTDMTMVGRRHPFLGNYFLSADPTGRIEKIRLDFLADAGYSYDCTLAVTDLVVLSADSAYEVDTFRSTVKACRTNVSSNTAMRSFGVIQCTLIAEEAIERLAHELGILPERVRELNFYPDAISQKYSFTPYGQALDTCRINQVWQDFKAKVDFDTRVREVQTFNQQNRWRKRGISMIPIKYGISYTYAPMNEGTALILIYGNDGTVLVKHGGVEMGQGIHTKMAFVAAQALGIDSSLIKVSGTDTADVPNAPSTGASTGTDLNGGAIKQACDELRQRLLKLCKPYGGKCELWTPGRPDLWRAVVAAAEQARINLSSQALYAAPRLGGLDSENQLKPGERMFYYFTYSVGVSEVEIDVLTGEHTILRTDLVYDSGKSLNSTLDFGQIEGGFIQGVGNVTTEEIYLDDGGRLLPNGTWNYKPPCTKTIPVEFNVSMLKYVYDPTSSTPMDAYGIHSSKSTGEPPLVLATSVFFAIKHAILAARADSGNTHWFDLDSPATVERIQNACLVTQGRLIL